MLNPPIIPLCLQIISFSIILLQHKKLNFHKFFFFLTFLQTPSCVYGETVAVQKNKINPASGKYKSLHHCLEFPCGSAPFCRVFTRLSAQMWPHSQCCLLEGTLRAETAGSVKWELTWNELRTHAGRLEENVTLPQVILSQGSKWSEG